MINEILNIPVIKSENGRAFLSYTMDMKKVTIYQLEMLANNQVPNILESEIVRLNGEIHLSFDITSMITLKKLFERKEIGRQDFIHIIQQIVSLLDGLEEYLLDYGGVVFDNKYIFVNPKTLDLSFVYLPTKDVKAGLDTLKSFLIESIIQHIRFKNEQSDNYVQKLLELIKAQELNLPILKDYLKDLEKIEHISTATPKSFKYDSIINYTNYSNLHREQDEKPRGQNPKQQKATSEFHLDRQTPDDEKIINTYPKKSYIILFSAIATFVAFGIVLCFTGALTIGSPDFLITLFGYLLIGGALSYLIHSKLFTPDKKIEKKESKTINISPSAVEKIKPQTIFKANAEMNYNDFKYVNKNIGLPNSIKRKENQLQYDKNKEYSEDLTVVLGAISNNEPYLKGVNSAVTVNLTQFPFMVGRLKEQVDYFIKNPAVGKLHAEITKQGAQYYVTDMNSRNGTLINGARLMPGQNCRLKRGDQITFANEQFTFYC